jgi:hypothetical protein
MRLTLTEINEPKSWIPAAGAGDGASRVPDLDHHRG